MEDSRKVLALIIDNYVEEIFECDERMAAILTSNPTVVDITSKKDIVSERGIFYDKNTHLFYRRVDLEGQYTKPKDWYPHKNIEIETIPLNVEEEKKCNCNK